MPEQVSFFHQCGQSYPVDMYLHSSACHLSKIQVLKFQLYRSHLRNSTSLFPQSYDNRSGSLGEIEKRTFTPRGITKQGKNVFHVVYKNKLSDHFLFPKPLTLRRARVLLSCQSCLFYQRKRLFLSVLHYFGVKNCRDETGKITFQYKAGVLPGIFNSTFLLRRQMSMVIIPEMSVLSMLVQVQNQHKAFLLSVPRSFVFQFSQQRY